MDEQLGTLIFANWHSFREEEIGKRETLKWNSENGGGLRCWITLAL